MTTAQEGKVGFSAFYDSDIRELDVLNGIVCEENEGECFTLWDAESLLNMT